MHDPALTLVRARADRGTRATDRARVRQAASAVRARSNVHHHVGRDAIAGADDAFSVAQPSRKPFASPVAGFPVKVNADRSPSTHPKFGSIARGSGRRNRAGSYAARSQAHVSI
jgi:hypothetical protein